MEAANQNVDIYTVEQVEKTIYVDKKKLRYPKIEMLLDAFCFFFFLLLWVKSVFTIQKRKRLKRHKQIFCERYWKIALKWNHARTVSVLSNSFTLGFVVLPDLGAFYETYA